MDSIIYDLNEHKWHDSIYQEAQYNRYHKEVLSRAYIEAELKLIDSVKKENPQCNGYLYCYIKDFHF